MAERDDLIAALLGRYADPGESYRSALRMATETPQAVDPSAQNAGPLTPINKLLLDIRGPNAEPQQYEDYVADAGKQLGLGIREDRSRYGEEEERWHE